MKLLYLTEYFHTPEEGGLMRTWELSKFLSEHGHHVTVVVPGAHHMTGEQPAELRGRLSFSRRVRDITVTKVWTWSAFRRGYLDRVLYYLSTPVTVLLASLRHPASVVMGSSPPFFLAPGAYLLARLKRVPFVLEVRDAWLEFAVAKGMVPRAMARILEAEQRWLFRRADSIVAVTPGIRDICIRSLPEEQRDKVLLVMNGYEEDVFQDADPARVEEIRKEWNLGDRKVVLYAGTMGLARDCMTFVRAAGRLRGRTDILFAFLGEGERKSAMQAYASEHQLENCLFVPMQPRKDMPAWLSAATVGLNSIKAGEGLESSLSNKIFDYLGAGIPVVWSGEGDTTQFLEMCGGGISVGSEDDAAMAAGIAQLCDDPAAAREMGRRGQRYVLDNLSRTKLVVPLEELLAGLAGERSRVRSAVTSDREVERIRGVYAYYDRTPGEQAKRDRANRGNAAIAAERERKLGELLIRHFGERRARARVLDVGCGRGDWLAWLERLGFPAAGMVGIDLLPDRIELARRDHPSMRFDCLNAEELAEPAGSFDLVVTSTVFSSILDGEMRGGVAARLERLLAPGGAVLWYDFRYANPRNPHTRPLDRADVAALFPTLTPALRPMTLLPPLARRLGVAAPVAYPLLAALPPLRGHLGGLLTRAL